MILEEERRAIPSPFAFPSGEYDMGVGMLWPCLQYITPQKIQIQVDIYTVYIYKDKPQLLTMDLNFQNHSSTANSYLKRS